MTLPAKALAPAFDLKSMAWTLTTLRLQTSDLDHLCAALEARFGATPQLFDSEPVAIDLGPLKDSDAAIDFAALQALLRRRGMLPIAVSGGSPAQMAEALAAGLAEAPAAAPPIRALPPAPSPEAPEPAAEPAVSDSEPILPEPATAARTLVVSKPLRSGQRVYARGGDLVVLAVVSHGAEVIADGSIHVYGPLRGRAMAGASGDTEARIFATCMEPQLVAIAGVYRTTETELPATVLGQLAQVRLDGAKILFEPLAS